MNALPFISVSNHLERRVLKNALLVFHFIPLFLLFRFSANIAFFYIREFCFSLILLIVKESQYVVVSFHLIFLWIYLYLLVGYPSHLSLGRILSHRPSIFGWEALHFTIVPSEHYKMIVEISQCAGSLQIYLVKIHEYGLNTDFCLRTFVKWPYYVTWVYSQFIRVCFQCHLEWIKNN